MPDSARSAPLPVLARRLGLVVLLLTCAPLAWGFAASPKEDPPASPAGTQATPSTAPGQATAAKPGAKPAPKPAPKPAAKPAAKAAKPAPAAKASPSEEVLRFTNDDLPKIASQREDEAEEGGKTADAPPEDAAASKAKKSKAKADESDSEEKDEEAEDFEDVLGAEERAAKTIVLQRQIAEGEKRIEQLESRRRALQNPLHAGLFPAGTEEQEAVGGQGNDVRLAWVEEQIRATRKAMNHDREELARIQEP